jgi:O-antigen/teichoic acid export membrane protein
MKLLDRILNKSKLSDNRRKVIKNVYWAVLGKVVGILNQLLVGIMVARYLGPEQFGLMSYVVSYVMLFSVLASFGLDGIEIRELSRTGADKNAIMGTAFALRLGFALITTLLILLTLLRFEADPYTFAMVMVFSLSLIASAFNVIRNYFTSIILNEYVVKTEISRSVVGALIKVVLLLSHCSLTWFIVASTFDFMLVAGGYLFAYRKKVGPVRAWGFDPFVAKMLLRESFPLLLSGTALIIYQRMDAIMIRNMLDNAAVGQFSVASRITDLSVFVPMIIAQTIVPLLVQAQQFDEKRYRAKCQQFMDVLVWSSIAMAIVLSLTSEVVISVLYGEKYSGAIPVLRIIAWKSVFVALAAGSGNMIIIDGYQKHYVFKNLMGCVANIGLNFALIPIYGLVGAACASLVSVAVAGYISHYLIGPYRYLTKVQNSALLFGWRIVYAPLNKFSEKSNRSPEV